MQKCSGSMFLPAGLCAQWCRALVDLIKNELFLCSSNFIAAISQSSCTLRSQMAAPNRWLGGIGTPGLVLVPPLKWKEQWEGHHRKLLSCYNNPSLPQSISAQDENLSKTMFLPLAERMVEKMVKEDKIEAEAEVRLGLSFVETRNALLRELDYLGKLKIIKNVLEFNVNCRGQKENQKQGVRRALESYSWGNFWCWFDWWSALLSGRPQEKPED